MKLLLYCTKAKPYLYFENDLGEDEYGMMYEPQWLLTTDYCFDKDYAANGKIVAECDFEVEVIKLPYTKFKTNEWVNSEYERTLQTNTLDEKDILKLSCIDEDSIYKYLNFKYSPHNVGYAIHIKNLHIFDEPKKTSEYNTYNRNGKVHIADIPIYIAPQNMMYAFDYYGNPFVLISIRPEWLCKILNGEKTIEVRKKVLKEML